MHNPGCDACVVTLEPIGPKLAEGRDSEIYEHGPGRVLRVARDGRSLVAEAEVMRYARRHGYPVPEVHDAGEGYLVMDRLVGPTMSDAALKRPWRIGSFGRVLADLQQRLHAIPAPPDVPGVAVPGDALLHRDLHPMNVLMTAAGPVVIDWSNAARGDGAYDVADTWVLMRCADPGLGGLGKVVVAAGRRLFLRGFLGSFDRAAARAAIPAAVEDRLRDRNLSEVEKQRMRRMAEWALSQRPSPPPGPPT